MLSHLPSCFESVLRVTVESVQGTQVCLVCTGTSGPFEMVARPLEFLSSVKLRPPPLDVRWEHRVSFPDEAGKWTLISGREGKTRALLELWRDPRCSSRVETGTSENFLSCIKGVKDPFKAQEVRWDFCRDSTAERSHVSH